MYGGVSDGARRPDDKSVKAATSVAVHVPPAAAAAAASGSSPPPPCQQQQTSSALLLFLAGVRDDDDAEFTGNSRRRCSVTFARDWRPQPTPTTGADDDDDVVMVDARDILRRSPVKGGISSYRKGVHVFCVLHTKQQRRAPGNAAGDDHRQEPRFASRYRHYVVAGPAGLAASVGLEALKRMAAAVDEAAEGGVALSTSAGLNQDLDRIRRSFADVETALTTVKSERRLAKVRTEVEAVRAANLQILSDAPIDELLITNHGGAENHAELIARSTAFLASANARRQRERRRTAGIVAVVGGVVLVIVASVLACREDGTSLINWTKCRSK